MARFRFPKIPLEVLPHADARLDRSPVVETLIKKTALPTPHLAIITAKVTDPYRLQPFQTFMMDDSTGEATSLVSFASIAAALMHHDAMVRVFDQK